MLDIKFVRANPDAVKENIKKKFQDYKLPMVDEVIELDAKSRAVQQEASALRSERNKISKQIGGLMAKGMKVGIYPLSEDAFLDMGEFEEMKRMEEKLHV